MVDFITLCQLAIVALVIPYLLYGVVFLIVRAAYDAKHSSIRSHFLKMCASRDAAKKQDQTK